MRIFAPERVKGLMQKLGMEEGEAIEHPWVTRAIENAQRKVEGHNFDIRKQLLDYDNVANDQRKVIYEQRNDIMATDDISETITAIRADVINNIIDTHIPPQSLEEQWDIPGLEEALEQMGARLPVSKWLEEDHDLHEEILRQRILEAVEKTYAEKEAQTGAEVMRHFEKAVMLQVLDSMWKEHLAAMDYLRQGIHLRGYAQKNPIQEYKIEAFALFNQLLNRIKTEVISILTKVRVRAEEDVQAVEQQRRSHVTMRYEHAEATALAAAGGGGGGDDMVADDQEAHTPYVREGRKVGRNEPCPCGSGKKYKQCHGRLE
jgi:preprotein translocase subunit SecA